MTFKLNPSGGQPLYLQLMQQVRHGIETGVLQDGDLMPGIEATTKSPPARAEQLRSRHAMPARLFDSERTFGQFSRNARSWRHAENAGRCAGKEQRRLLTPSVGCARYQGVAIANGGHTRRSWL